MPSGKGKAVKNEIIKTGGAVATFFMASVDSLRSEGKAGGEGKPRKR